MRTLINQNVNYANHTSSSSPSWNSSSARTDSLSTIIRNQVIILPEVPDTGQKQVSAEREHEVKLT